MPAAIGERLREAREAAGVDLEEVNRTIRIRTRYLRALEDEEWDVLPGDAYVRGFLHSYGDYLGLDGASLVAQYDQLAAATPEREIERPLEAPRPAAGVPPWRRVGLIAAIAVAALAAILIVLGITGGSSHHGRGKGQASRHHAAGGRTGTNARKTTTSTAATQATVSLSPTGTVWVCLVDASGKPLVNGETLTAGESRGPFKSRDMKLTLGNGEVRIELNGKPVAVPAASNPVGLELTPQGARPLSAADSPTCA